MNPQWAEDYKLTTSLPDRNTNIRIHQPPPPPRYRTLFRTVEIIPRRKRTSPRRRLGASRQLLHQQRRGSGEGWRGWLFAAIGGHRGKVRCFGTFGEGRGG